MAGLKGKTGIVTGGSSGIGFQIANVLAQAGATVYVISRTGKPKEGDRRKCTERCPSAG